MSELSLSITTKGLRRVLESARIRGAKIKHHPLGFLRLPLSSRDAPERYYVHVWPGVEIARLDPSSEIHNHNFDLHSRVLLGGLTNREYNVEDDEDGPGRLLTMRYEGDHTGRVPTSRRVRYQLAATCSYLPGDVYQIAKRTFHETVIDKRPTATLMRKTSVDKHSSPLNIDQSNAIRSDFSYKSTAADVAWQILFDSLAHSPMAS